MSEQFDPYLQWLDIPPSEQPPNYYRLLGLSRDESDLSVIAAAADGQLARLRDRQLGDRAKVAVRLMSEVTTARRCLLDPESKAAYDAALTGDGVPEPPPPQPPPPPAPAESDESQQEFLPAVSRRGRPASRHVRRSRQRSNSLGMLILIAVVVMLLIGLVLVARNNARRSKVPDDAVALPPVSDETSLAGKTVIVPEDVIAQQEDGYLLLSAEQAEVDGRGSQTNGAIEWGDGLDAMRWELFVDQPGFFAVEVNYAADRATDQQSAKISIAEDDFDFPVRNTGGLEDFTTDKVKTIMIRRGGRYELEIRRPDRQIAPRMRLKSVNLRPIGRK